MDPFNPNDPLWKLMSKARQGVPRANFSQKVVRAARQQAQALSWWSAVGEWLATWQRPLMVGAAATAVLVVTCLRVGHDGSPSAIVVAMTAPVSQVADADLADIADEDFSIPLDSLDHMDALVAREDTSSLTDAEIQFLLY